MYKGLETGERNISEHVVKLNDIIFVFKSALNPGNTDYGESLMKHGDCVKDVAFSVVDLDYLVQKAKESGAKIVKDIWSEKDENGFVRMATIQTVTPPLDHKFFF